MTQSAGVISSVIQSFPPELLEDIFEYLIFADASRGDATLHSCSLTCRRFGQIAQRALFKNRNFATGKRFYDAMLKVSGAYAYAPPMNISLRASPGNHLVYCHSMDTSEKRDDVDNVLHIPYPSLRLAGFLSGYPLHTFKWTTHFESVERGEIFDRRVMSTPWRRPEIAEQMAQAREVGYEVLGLCLPSVREVTFRTSDSERSTVGQGMPQLSEGMGALFPRRTSLLMERLVSRPRAFAAITHLNLYVVLPLDVRLFSGAYFPHLVSLVMKSAYFSRLHLQKWFDIHDAESAAAATPDSTLAPRPQIRRFEFSLDNPMYSSQSRARDIRWFFHKRCTLDFSKLEHLDLDIYDQQESISLSNWLSAGGGCTLRSLSLVIKPGEAAWSTLPNPFHFDRIVPGPLLPQNLMPLPLGNLSALQSLLIDAKVRPRKPLSSSFFNIWIRETLPTLPELSRLENFSFRISLDCYQLETLYERLRKGFSESFNDVFLVPTTSTREVIPDSHGDATTGGHTTTLLQRRPCFGRLDKMQLRFQLGNVPGLLTMEDVEVQLRDGVGAVVGEYDVDLVVGERLDAVSLPSFVWHTLVLV